MEEQINNIEQQLGFITFTINEAQDVESRKSLEDKYNQEIEMLSNQLEQLKNN